MGSVRDVGQGTRYKGRGQGTRDEGQGTRNKDYIIKENT